MDLVIRNAQIFDGSGEQASYGDVAVKTGVIVAIGENLAVTGTQEVDANGLSLMPGIIDSHTHFDAQISWDSTLAPSSSLVTPSDEDGAKVESQLI